MSLKGDYQSADSIDELLAKPDCTVDELLNDENFASECKGRNPKLLAFLTSKRHLLRLLDFVTKMPSEEDSHDRAHRHPFLVNEMFSQEGSSLLDPFFEEEVEESASEESPTKSEDWQDAKDGEESEATAVTQDTADPAQVAQALKQDEEEMKVEDVDDQKEEE